MQLHLGHQKIVVNGEATETGAATVAELVAELGYNEGPSGDGAERRLRAEERASPNKAERRRQHRDRGAASGRLS